MRIWDIPPKKLCRNHLLGEHRELHAIWVVITKNKKGYSKHPETLRWKGKLRPLYLRHEQLVDEMRRRGYKHKSKLPAKLAVGRKTQNDYIDSIKGQINILKRKGCECKV
ncbi:pyrimidine dimer DNA glycosylase/endonuclease V [Candidatus Omnitrophota bacterium]